MILYPMVISAFAVFATLVYASYLDINDRRVPFRTWYPMLVVGIPSSAYFYLTLGLTGRWALVAGYIGMSVIFSLIFYLFAYKNLFGGADAWALIFIAACIPFFPIEPALGYPPLGFLPFTVLVNAVVLNLAAPLSIFIGNIVKGNHAPLPYLFLGFPVEGDKIQQSFGYVMEEIEEKDGVIVRSFIGIRESIHRLFTGENRIYTKELRLHPEKFKKELRLYEKAGTVWISYAVPFIIPITAGLITAILCGDFLLAIMKIVMGGI